MATTKKTIKKAPAKPVVKTAPAAAQAACQCTGGCGCRHGFGRFVKKLILFVIVFALGWAACCCFCCGHKGKMFGKFGHGAEFKHMFVNGCLDLSKIQCPEKAQKIAAVAATADADADGCISPKELKAAFKASKDAE